MKDRTKETLKDGFGSLINNACAIRGAKNGPLWLTILMFVFTLIFAVLPTTIDQLKRNGSTFIKSYSYNLETYVTDSALKLKNDRKAKFTIGEDHLLTIAEDGNSVNFSNYGKDNQYLAYTDASSGQYDFVIYLSDASSTDEKKAFVNELNANYFLVGTTEKAAADAESKYIPSYMVFFKDGLYVCVYPEKDVKYIAQSYSGDFVKVPATEDLLTDLLTVKDFTGEQSVYNNDYCKAVLENYKQFLNNSYKKLKVKNVLVFSAIYFGVYFGLSLIMGFLMWLLTRGKNNPNNYYTVWLCYKIQARLGLAPAIITLIAGIFLASYAPIIFIVTVGLRVMWMSMKELRPVQQQ